jgi:cysteine synthase
MPVPANVSTTAGRTPLIKLNRIAADVPATVAVKAEFFNPLGRVKDRIGFAMINAAEREGILHPKPPSSSRPPETPASRSPSLPPPEATG